MESVDERELVIIRKLTQLGLHVELFVDVLRLGGVSEVVPDLFDHGLNSKREFVFARTTRRD